MSSPVLALGTLDPHQQIRVKSTTLDTYKKVASAFCSWLDTNAIYPNDEQDWDIALVSYKNDTLLTRTNYDMIERNVVCGCFYWVCAFWGVGPRALCSSNGARS